MIVLDASAVLEVLLRTPAGEALTARVLHPRQALHAPHLLDVEAGQVLRRFCAHSALAPARAQEALEDLDALPIERHEHALLLPRAWELRANLSIYDGVYVALAELLRAPLVTRDRRLAGAPGHRVRVEVI